MNATLLRSAKQEAGPSVALVPGDTNMFYVLETMNILLVIFLFFQWIWGLLLQQDQGMWWNSHSKQHLHSEPWLFRCYKNKRALSYDSIFSDTYSTSGTCTYKITKISKDDICMIRLDFESMILETPTSRNYD